MGIQFDFVHINSDGASQHFKSQFSMACLLVHRECDADWSFLESYHGKGAHDGLGAVIKFNIRTLVLQRSVVLMNAHDVFELAKSFCEDTCVIYVDSLQIESDKPKCDKVWSVSIKRQMVFTRLAMFVSSRHISSPCTQTALTVH